MLVGLLQKEQMERRRAMKSKRKVSRK